MITIKIQILQCVPKGNMKFGIEWENDGDIYTEEEDRMTKVIVKAVTDLLDGKLQPPSTARIGDLAMLLRRVAHNPTNVSVVGKALDYLKRHGLDGSPLK